MALFHHSFWGRICGSTSLSLMLPAPRRLHVFKKSVLIHVTVCTFFETLFELSDDVDAF